MRPWLSLRYTADALGQRGGVEPQQGGSERRTALLPACNSLSSRCSLRRNRNDVLASGRARILPASRNALLAAPPSQTFRRRGERYLGVGVGERRGRERARRVGLHTCSRSTGNGGARIDGAGGPPDPSASHNMDGPGRDPCPSRASPGGAPAPTASLTEPGERVCGRSPAPDEADCRAALHYAEGADATLHRRGSPGVERCRETSLPPWRAGGSVRGATGDPGTAAVKPRPHAT